MRLCGHTMGTPALSLEEAMALFAKVGYEGIEIRCADNGHLHPEDITEQKLQSVCDCARRVGLEIACLTPYYGDYSSPEATRLTVEGLTKVARAAQKLGCKIVRAIPGHWPLEGTTFLAAQRQLADGLRAAGDAVAPYDVTLGVETHGGTLAFNADTTLALLALVEHPKVRLILDYYWLAVAGDEDPDSVMPDLVPLTAHVHVKDLVWHGKEHGSVPLGQGQINWPLILAHLLAWGYDGYLSDEYEKLWHPKLPD
ncbi:MAG: sugar phosphate isomerase/epimerase family protein, partial [Armatimonadota bacterium]